MARWLQRTGLGSRVALRTFLVFAFAAALPIALFAVVGYAFVSAELTGSAQSRLNEASKRYGIALNERLIQTETLLIEAARLELEAQGSAGPGTLLRRLQIHSAFAPPREGARWIPIDADALPVGWSGQRTLTVDAAGGEPKISVTVSVSNGARSVSLVGNPVDADFWAPAMLLPESRACVTSQTHVLHCESGGSADDERLTAVWPLFLKPRYGVADWVIRIDQSRAESLAALGTFRVMLPIVALLAIAIATLLSAVQIRRSHRPLAELAAAADRLGRGEFSEGVNIAGDDEFASVGGAFNTLAKRLEDRERALLRRAYFDPLTELPNRALFVDRLDQQLRRARSEARGCAVLQIGLDGFKTVNESLGRGCGDGLLTSVARRLAAALQEGDLVARIGGDEFAVACVCDGTQQVHALAARLMQSLAEPQAVGDRNIVVSASIGVAAWHDGISGEQLLNDADAALHRAKQRGRAQLAWFEGEMTEVARRRLHVEQRLREALARGELQVAYQPKLSTVDGRVRSLEALARWNDAELGIVAPVEFIPIAESSGLITALGASVLGEACQQLCRWRAEGFAVEQVAVNASVHQLRRADFLAVVEAALAAAGLAPCDLQLEITESSLANDDQMVMENLQRLQQMGASIAMDDFGTGYSSLASLRDLPIDVLKIDRSFVIRSAETGGDQALLRGVVSLAHVLGKTVVAEGVETQAQLELLKELGCDEVQGYLVGRPTDAQGAKPLLPRAASVRLVPHAGHESTG